MNLTEIKAMTDEALRIKVAELLGWKDCRPAVRFRKEGAPPVGSRPDQHLGDANDYALPDYPADLNACHEMEKALLGDNWHDYAALLKSTSQFRWHATARQRCEAFVRVMEGQ